MVFSGDNLIHERYFGKMNWEHSVDFDFNTQVRICSNSKLFTAVSILQLVEQGKIASVHSNINDYLDASDMEAWGLPKGTQKWCPKVFGQTQTICQQKVNITFASMMSMQSGLMSPTTCSAPPVNGSSDWYKPYCTPWTMLISYDGSIASTIAQVVNAPLWTLPDLNYDMINKKSAYFYSNENFIYLSYIIEKLSGMSYRDYLQQHIFSVMGLDNTFYDPLSQVLEIKPKLAAEYYFYMNLPFGPSYSAGNDGNYPPFAIGNCASTEVSPGVQTGSGGIVSTLPDMIKWYSSLFVTKNATTAGLLNEESIKMLWYPWAVQNPVQYYGFGTETMYDSAVAQGHVPYPTPPADPAFPDLIYYMGGSACSFITIIAQFGDRNVFTGEELVTLPLVTVVNRNNRMLNLTEDVWSAAKSTKNGYFYQLSQQPYNWNDPACCDNFVPGSSLTDTMLPAFNLSYYFAARPLPEPTPSLPTYSYVRSRTFSGNTCNGRFAGPLNGTTTTSCTAMRLRGVVSRSCQPFPSASSPSFSSKTDCVETTNPFQHYGTGLFEYWGPKEGCNTIYTSSFWQFTAVGDCNRNPKKSGNTLSYRLVSCDSRKGWVMDYFSSEDCSGTRVTRKAQKTKKECRASSKSRGTFEGSLCIIAPKA
jgi:CubicO group peptidase (beta-lactamase class C family)